MLDQLDLERLTALYTVHSNEGVSLNNLSPEFMGLNKSSSCIESCFIYFSNIKPQFQILIKYSETSYCRNVKTSFVYSEEFSRFFSERALLIKPNTQYDITIVNLFAQAKGMGCCILDPKLGSITTHLINPSDNILIDEIISLTQYLIYPRGFF